MPVVPFPPLKLKIMYKWLAVLLALSVSYSFQNKDLTNASRNLVQTPLPIIERDTIPPTNGSPRPALLANSLRVDFFNPELEPFGVDLALPGVPFVRHVFFLFGKLSLALAGPGQKVLLGLGLWHVVEDVPLHLDELGDAHLVVGGQDVVAKGLGGVLAGELAGLGDGDEELLHGEGVDVDVVDGLEWLFIAGEVGAGEHFFYGEGVGDGHGGVLTNVSG